MKNIISTLLILQSLFCFSQNNYDYSVKRKIDSLVTVEKEYYNDGNYDESIKICQKLIELGFEEGIYKGYKKMLISRYLKYYPNKDLTILNEAIENANSFIAFMKNSAKYKNEYYSIYETYGLVFQYKYELAEIKSKVEIFEDALVFLDEAEKMQKYLGKEEISRLKFNKAKAYLKIYELSFDNSRLFIGFENCKEANDYYSNLTTDQIVYFNSKQLLARYHLELSSIEKFDYHKKSAEEIILDLDKTYDDSYYYHRIKDIDSLKIKVKELTKQN